MDCFLQMEDVSIPIINGSMDDVGDEEVRKWRERERGKEGAR